MAAEPRTRHTIGRGSGFLGAADDVVYRLACETERVLVTLNYQDFRLMEHF